MDQARFEEVFEEQVAVCRKMLIQKAAEYADDLDRLRNFNTAARLENVPRSQALGGMMGKHTVSIYDMIFSGADHEFAVWEEKITDHINYLILLRAILVDDILLKSDALMEQPQLPLRFDPTIVKVTNHA